MILYTNVSEDLFENHCLKEPSVTSMASGLGPCLFWGCVGFLYCVIGQWVKPLMFLCCSPVSAVWTLWAAVCQEEDRTHSKYKNR